MKVPGPIIPMEAPAGFFQRLASLIGKQRTMKVPGPIIPMEAPAGFFQRLASLIGKRHD